MQDFREDEKKTIKMTASRPFWILFLRNFHGLSLCESLHFVLYARSNYFALFLSSVNIAKLIKFKMAARPLFQNCLLPKVNQVIG